MPLSKKIITVNKELQEGKIDLHHNQDYFLKEYKLAKLGHLIENFRNVLFIHKIMFS